MKLDKYEKELIEKEDAILSQAREPTDAERKRLEFAAHNTLIKDKRINIRISSRDLGALQRKASQYGMPYQTLISSVLHRYITGDLGDAVFQQDSAAKEDKPRR